MKTRNDFKHFDERLWSLHSAERYAFFDIQSTPGVYTTALGHEEENDVLLYARSAAVAVKQLVESEGDAWALDENGRICDTEVVRANHPQATNSPFDLAYKLDPVMLQQLFPGHSFNPYLAVWIEALTKFPDVAKMLGWLDSLSNEEKKGAVAGLNQLALYIRHRSNDSMIVSALNSWFRRIRARHSSAKRYIKEIFDFYPSLLVAHFDLAYRTIDGVHPSGQDPLTEVKKDLAKFDRFVHKVYPSVGHLYWREYGKQSGFTIRVMVFVNPTLRPVSDGVLDDFEDAWRRIARGMGHCVKRACFPISAWELKSVDGRPDHALNTMLEARITMADFWVFHKEGGKCFGRGQRQPELAKAMGYHTRR